MPQIERIVEIKAPIHRVFEFATDIRNHHLLVPPQTREQLLDGGDAPLHLGVVVRLRARYGGVYWTLASKITAFTPPDPVHPDTAYFRDEQVRGPFAVWRHDHWFASTPDGATRLTDRFTYAAPCGPIGKLVESLWLNAQMNHLLEFIQTAQKNLIETNETR